MDHLVTILLTMDGIIILLTTLTATMLAYHTYRMYGGPPAGEPRHG